MGNIYVKRLEAWKTAAERRDLTNISATISDGRPTIQAHFTLPVGQASYRLVYSFEALGRIRVNATYTPGADKVPTMPRFGMRLAVPRELDQISWYGRGPHETYWDRKTGGELAVYHNTVDYLNFPYIRPQDVGNRTDVRWVTLSSLSGLGLKVIGTQPLSVSVLPFSQEDLAQAQHPNELPRRNYNIVHIDWKLHGVGGDNSWGAKTHPDYTLSGNRPYEYEFVLTPLRHE